MLEYETYTTDLFNTLWGPQPGTSYLDRQLETSILIVGMLQSTTPQTTIDELVKQLFHHFNVSSRDAEPHQDAARHLVLASIGWSTMLYTASITTPGLSTVGNQPRSETGRRSLLSWWHRPLGTALRTRGQMPIACPPRAADARGIDTLLPVTHLNLFTLTRLGDVSIVWVDDLSHHCDFDRYSRKKELRLFRFPSLCASICINQTDGSLLGRLFRSHPCQNNCQSVSETVAKAYLVEILLSYRLLFGQHSSSRKLYCETERENAKSDGLVDPLLDSLCGARGVNDFIAVKELLRERGVYNAQVNFPHLGHRLMELQDYSTSQRPRDIFEVWNDIRDPERLLTFRAVIVVGGVSIFLSILQVFVGLAQVLT